MAVMFITELHIDKFMPPWVCVGTLALLFVAFLAVLIVLATNRRAEEDRK
jgi:hypothetical protein